MRHTRKALCMTWRVSGNISESSSIRLLLSSVLEWIRAIAPLLEVKQIVSQFWLEFKETHLCVFLINHLHILKSEVCDLWATPKCNQSFSHFPVEMLVMFTSGENSVRTITVVARPFITRRTGLQWESVRWDLILAGRVYLDGGKRLGWLKKWAWWWYQPKTTTTTPVYKDRLFSSEYHTQINAH